MCRQFLLSDGRGVRYGVSATPTLDRGEGDNDNAFAPFAFQFQTLFTHLGDQLSALTACFKGLAMLQRRTFRSSHNIEPRYNEIENDY